MHRESNRVGKGLNKVVYPVLAVLGLVVLLGDVAGDITFFSDPSLRTEALVLSAFVRNTLTAVAVVALFFRKEWAAYALLLAALLGGWRRISFLAPLTAGSADQWLLVHSGLDVGFRTLILGVGLGYFLARFEEEKT